MKKTRGLCAVLLLAVMGLGLLAPPSLAHTNGPPTEDTGLDPFYDYSGTTPLEDFDEGDILDSRTVDAHILGLRTPAKAVQLLYRTQDALGRPSANVTSVLLPSDGYRSDRVVSFQSLYDSLDPQDGPSRTIAGELTWGGLLVDLEIVVITDFLLKGIPVIMTDTEGQGAHFAAGPEYGTNTLDGLRAMLNSEDVKLDAKPQIGLMGYSGGAIGTAWASALVASYAPEIEPLIVGASEGGLLVKPMHNLSYISGSLGWAGIGAMAIVGLSRAYEIDLDPYMNDYARELLPDFEKKSILGALFQYPWLEWKHIVKPEYEDPASIPALVEVANKVNLGLRESPSFPVQIQQGTGGWMEGTGKNLPGIGVGDGVMVTGDARALANQYCADGTPMEYMEGGFSHIVNAVEWWLKAAGWMMDRFEGKEVASDCGRIAPGNDLSPTQVVSPSK